jgi:uncharacterized protein YukE
VGINTSAARQYADRLRSHETQLTQAKNNLRTYRSTLSSNWHGEESVYIVRAIDQVLTQIGNAQNQLMPLARDIEEIAEQIRREEEAAAALAQKQVRIRQVRAELDVAQKAADELKQKLDELLKISGKRQPGFMGGLTEAMNQPLIKVMQAEYDDAVKRVAELQDLLNQLSR